MADPYTKLYGNSCLVIIFVLNINAFLNIYEEYQMGSIYIAAKPKDAIAKVGKSVQLDCAALGLSATDRLTWWVRTAGSTGYRQIFTSSNPASYDTSKYEIRGQYSVYVKDVEKSDAGSYVCDVAGQANHSAELIVTSKW